jgi:hypothetical protein
MIGYSDIMKAITHDGLPHELCHCREKTNMPPLLLAGEGWGEAEGGPLASGYNFTPSPFSSPLGERKGSYFLHKNRKCSFSE